MRFELDVRPEPIRAHSVYGRLAHPATCNCPKCSAFEAEAFEPELLSLDAEVEEEFRKAALPAAVRDAYNAGPLSWALAVQRAIQAGIRDLNLLTNIVFFMHHPERMQGGGLGRALSPMEPGYAKLASEWKGWRELVKPMLAKAPAAPATGATPSGALKYGVPGGKILSGYLQHRKSGYHTGIDVSTSSSPGKGAEDPRRGLPVYASVRTSIDIATLNSVQVAAQKAPPWRNGLGIPGHGVATLRDAEVYISAKKDRRAYEYGGTVGLACRYIYTTTDRTAGVFTLYVEYWHLITPEYLPKTGQGRIIALAEWQAAGKAARVGYGPKMKHGAKLVAGDFATPPLVGYLGATQWPHVHIHANYSKGVRGYLFYPRLDPTAVIA
jgi:hypothetical protein